ncbi:MAG: MarC family protein [Propionibacteriaceae bacterium]|nr:MarC family protein [Propionibacteriaceae bacterium]
MLSAALMFFLVMDPLGNVPLFLTALRNTPEERRQWVILRELLIALVVMVAFLFAGQGMMQILSIENSALEAAGGVILLLIAIRMVFPTPERNLREPHTDDEPFIVPLAVPYVAGPSLLAIEVVLISQNPEKWAEYLGALALAWLATAVILYMSGFLRRVVGDKTLIAMERLMGMLLVILAVQMMFEGTKEFFIG